MSKPRMTRLGEVLAMERDEVTLEPGETYRIAGIYSFGKGVFERERIRGADTSYASLFRLHGGHFVVSRLNGWEGAVDVVSPDLSGCFVSNEYPTFKVDADRAYPRYLHWIARWPTFWDQLIPRGSMVRRKRVQPAQLLDVEIPLPPIAEQRRIATRLDNARHRVSTAAGSQVRARTLDRALIDSAIARVLERGIASGWPVLALGEVADVNPRRDRLPTDTSVMFVPMAAVDERSGIVSAAEFRTAGEIQSGYKQFRCGDVIFARITPCMQNGKTAIVDGPTTHGYGSTEFHVVRPGPLAQARWLHMVLRTHDFRRTAARRMTGTAGQQRVPAEFMERTPIPVPPLKDQEQALFEIDGYVRRWSELQRARLKASDLLAAVEPALLNECFGDHA